MRRGALIAAVVAAALAIGVAAVAARSTLAADGAGIHDTFIFLRYARNLVDGHGWVWNPGGEAVEGTTSPLWTLLVAITTAVAGDPRS